ncbi:MAG: hypothetical protein HQ579_02155, partial [Candidatus Omnitrophica bacterium]|nr:hypothetical protein [Candidatus Omnitrophota bacterium]
YERIGAIEDKEANGNGIKSGPQVNYNQLLLILYYFTNRSDDDDCDLLQGTVFEVFLQSIDTKGQQIVIDDKAAEKVDEEVPSADPIEASFLDDYVFVFIGKILNWLWRYFGWLSPVAPAREEVRQKKEGSELTATDAPKIKKKAVLSVPPVEEKLIKAYSSETGETFELPIFIKRNGVILAPDKRYEKYILNAGVLTLGGKRFLFARRAAEEVFDGIRRSDIGLYIHNEDGEEEITVVDRYMLTPLYEKIIPENKNVIALEDARVIERGGTIYVYLTVVIKKPLLIRIWQKVREVICWVLQIKYHGSSIHYYSAVTTHDAQEFIDIVDEQTDNEKAPQWNWTPIKRLITDGPCKGQNIKNFVPRGDVYDVEDDEGNVKEYFYATYRPDEKERSTIRLAVSEIGLKGPFKDIGEYRSIVPESGWIGTSTYVSGTDALPFNIEIDHKACGDDTIKFKYYDLRFLFTDKGNPNIKYETDPFMVPPIPNEDPDDEYNEDAFVPGPIYSCGAILTKYERETGECVFDVYYSRYDTIALWATITVIIPEEWREKGRHFGVKTDVRRTGDGSVSADGNKSEVIDASRVLGHSGENKKSDSTPGTGASIIASQPILTIDLPPSFEHEESDQVFDKIDTFLLASRGILREKEKDMDDVLNELASNVMQHGNGGRIEIYLEDKGVEGVITLRIIAVDNGEGLPYDPDTLVRDSIKARRKAHKKTRKGERIRGMGFAKITLSPDRVLVEYSRDKFVRVTNLPTAVQWFRKEEGESDVTKGMRFTLEFDVKNSMRDGSRDEPKPVPDARSSLSQDGAAEHTEAGTALGSDAEPPPEAITGFESVRDGSGNRPGSDASIRIEELPDDGRRAGTMQDLEDGWRKRMQRRASGFIGEEALHKIGTETTMPDLDQETCLEAQRYLLTSLSGDTMYGYYRIGNAPDRLTTQDIFSSNCLFVYDADTKIGATAHINFWKEGLLPYDENFMNSVARSLSNMIKGVVKAGADKKGLQFVIVRRRGTKKEELSKTNMQILEEAIKRLKHTSKSAFIETEEVTCELESGNILDGENRIVERFLSESAVSPDEVVVKKAPPGMHPPGMPMFSPEDAKRRLSDANRVVTLKLRDTARAKLESRLIKLRVELEKEEVHLMRRKRRKGRAGSNDRINSSQERIKYIKRQMRMVSQQIGALAASGGKPSAEANEKEAEKPEFDETGIAMNEPARRMAIQRMQEVINIMIAEVEANGNRLGLPALAVRAISGSYAGIAQGKPRIGIWKTKSYGDMANKMRVNEGPSDIDLIAPVTEWAEGQRTMTEQFFAGVRHYMLEEFGVVVEVWFTEPYGEWLTIERVSKDGLIRLYEESGEKGEEGGTRNKEGKEIPSQPESDQRPPGMNLGTNSKDEEVLLQKIKGFCESALTGLIEMIKGFNPEKTPQYLVFDAEDLLEKLIFYDIDETLGMIKDHDLLQGGKILVTQRDEALNERLGNLKKHIDDRLGEDTVIIVTKEECDGLRYLTDDVTEGNIPKATEALIRHLRKKDIKVDEKNILAIVKGNKGRCVFKYEQEVPFIMLNYNGTNDDRKPVFSLANILRYAVKARLDSTNGLWEGAKWLRILDPIGRFTDEMFENWLREHDEILTKA